MDGNGLKYDEHLVSNRMIAMVYFHLLNQILMLVQLHGALRATLRAGRWPSWASESSNVASWEICYKCIAVFIGKSSTNRGIVQCHVWFAEGKWQRLMNQPTRNPGLAPDLFSGDASKGLILCRSFLRTALPLIIKGGYFCGGTGS